MKTIRLHGPKDLRIHEEQTPLPEPGEVQIAVRSVGVCASDLHYFRDGRIGTTHLANPIIMGHEASGIITALGPNVDTLAVGDRVAIEPAKPCMQCEWCRSGHFNVCPDVQFFGTPPTDGCLREYITWPATLAICIPNSISFDEAAMVEPFAVGVYAVKLGQVKPEDVVVIIGAGAVGLSVLQTARIRRAKRTIVIEPIAARREIAKKLGADETIDPSIMNPTEAVNQITNNRGADIVFECAGNEEAVRESCRIARILGKVVIVGIPDGNDYPFDASAARRKELSSIFVRRSNCTTEEAIDLVAAKKVNVACYATHHFALEDAAKAMELANAKADGVVRATISLQ